MSEIRVDKIQGTSGTATALTLDGANSTVNGTLNVDGAVTLDTTLSVTGVHTIGNNAGVTGVHTIGNNAVVTSEGGAVTSNLAQGSIKAWCRSNNGTVAVDSFNISGTTDNAAGDYDIQINNNMSNANYAVITGADDLQDGAKIFATMIDQSQAIATTGYEVVFKGVGHSAFAKTDPNTLSASSVLGDLA